MRRRPGSWFSDKQTLRDPALGEVWPPSPIPVHRSRLGVVGCSKSLSELFSQATPGTGSRIGLSAWASSGSRDAEVMAWTSPPSAHGL